MSLDIISQPPEKTETYEFTTGKNSRFLSKFLSGFLNYGFLTSKISSLTPAKPFSVLGPQTQGDYIGPPEDTLTQHGRRIFSVKFTNASPYHLVSGGWDK